MLRFNLRSVFGALTIAVFLFGIGLFSFRWALGPVVPQSLLNQLQVGMSTAEVEQVLGKPDHVDKGTLVYRKPYSLSFLAVRFDESGRFVNYENDHVL